MSDGASQEIRYDFAMPHQAVKTVVFPVAGRGTRFLPVTKASPKEMLPIVDKPLIQYAVDEALSAGADTLVFITGSSKRAIEDHFDSNPELEAVLQAQGKQELLDTLRGILPSWASCVYIRQPAPLGLGHAVLCARPVVGDAPFMVHLADDLIDAKVPCLKQMVEVYAIHGGSVLGVQNVPRQDTDKYGIVSLERNIAPRVGKMSHIVEKPKPDKAASTLAVVGRYLLAARSSTIWQKSARAPAARFSSPTASRGSCSASRCMPSSSKASAMIAAASSDTCRPPSSMA